MNIHVSTENSSNIMIRQRAVRVPAAPKEKSPNRLKNKDFGIFDARAIYHMRVPSAWFIWVHSGGLVHLGFGSANSSSSAFSSGVVATCWWLVWGFETTRIPPAFTRHQAKNNMVSRKLLEIDRVRWILFNIFTGMCSCWSLPAGACPAFSSGSSWGDDITSLQKKGLQFSFLVSKTAEHRNGYWSIILAKCFYWFVSRTWHVSGTSLVSHSSG